jgi:hypothetical protein
MDDALMRLLKETETVAEQCDGSSIPVTPEEIEKWARTLFLIVLGYSKNQIHHIAPVPQDITGDNE